MCDSVNCVAGDVHNN